MTLMEPVKGLQNLHVPDLENLFLEIPMLYVISKMPNCHLEAPTKLVKSFPWVILICIGRSEITKLKAPTRHVCVVPRKIGFTETFSFGKKKKKGMGVSLISLGSYFLKNHKALCPFLTLSYKKR